MRGARALALSLALAALLAGPAGAWYKQAAGPNYYSVGRASGLLSGIRRSPYSRRAEPEPEPEPEAEAGPGPGPEGGPALLLPDLPGAAPRPPAALRAMALCVKDVAPELRSCQLLPGAPGTLHCKADVTVALDPAACA